MSKLISTKNRVFIPLVGLSETGKSQLLYKWLEIGTFQSKFDIFYFFKSTFPLLMIEISRLKWTKFTGRRQLCVNFQTDADKLNIVVYCYRNNLYLKDNEVGLK